MPLAAGRAVHAVFAEAAAPVAEALSLQLAGRYEDYGDGVHALTPKVGAVWRAAPGLSARKVGTGPAGAGPADVSCRRARRGW